MKDTLINLATGLIAKLIRYALTVAGGAVATASASADGNGFNVEQLAAGVSVVMVTFTWSLWEDWVKKRRAIPESAKAPPIK